MTRLEAFEQILETLASCDSYEDAIAALSAVEHMRITQHLRKLVEELYPDAPGRLRAVSE